MARAGTRKKNEQQGGTAEELHQNIPDARRRFKEDVRAHYTIDQAVADFSDTVLNGAPGRGQTVLCPFHDDTTPSMSIRPEEGYFCCHAASCGMRGDVFEFIMQMTGMNFREALLAAADKAGISPPESIPAARSTRPKTGSGAAIPRSRSILSPDPATLQESDLIPVFRGMRIPRPGQRFPVWKQTGNHADKPDVVTYRPDMVHVYRNMDEEPIMAVLRMEYSRRTESPQDEKSTRKIFVPIRVAKLPKEAPQFVVDDRENRLGWHVMGATTSRHRKPVYGMEHARKWFANRGRRILIVEGEKTCNAARRMISGLEKEGNPDDWLVLSPMGGYGAGLKADWSEFMECAAQDENGLSGVTFSVWPDADHDTGKSDGTGIDVQSCYVDSAVGAFVAAMRKQGLDPEQVNFTRAIPGTDRRKGWDLADAESESWTGDRVVRALDEEGMAVSVNRRYLESEIGPADADDGNDPVFPGDGPDDIDHLVLSKCDEDIPVRDEIPGSETPDSTVVPVDNDESKVEDFEVVETDSDNPEIEILFEGEKVVPVIEESSEHVEMPEAEISVIDGNDDDYFINGLNAVEENTWFRALGYRSCMAYYMSLVSNEIFVVSLSNMRKQTMISLAPVHFWQTYFGMVGQGGRMVIDWDDAMSAMVRIAYKCGYWNPDKQAGQGVRIDSGQVVLNTGACLWVQSEHEDHGIITDFNEYRGEYCYTIGDDCGLPDFDNAFRAGDREPLALLDLIRRIDWRAETANTSILSLFGWICVGPVCGVLPWRPHLWLDGRATSGKSWILENIVKPTLSDYMLWVKSNTTESGLRHALNGLAKPLVFDEADAEMDGDSKRMAGIMKLARHSSTPGDSVVIQGVSGGGGQKFYSIASTFLFASVTPQLETSADKTRFARASLGSGHEMDHFVRHIEVPADNLLTQKFSRRLIARIIMRAGAIGDVQKKMVRGLTSLNIERRLADVWGTYAAGAWCVLEDGIPKDYVEAMAWIERTFRIKGEMIESADEIEDDRDHDSLFRHLMAHELRCETLHTGVRTFNLGTVMRMAISRHEDEDEIFDMRQARKRLANIGIRLGHEGKPAKMDQTVDSLIIHRNSPQISKILSETPYYASYVDVIQQAENVVKGPPAGFGGLGVYRSVIVPLEHFTALENGDDHDQDAKGGR